MFNNLRVGARVLVAHQHRLHCVQLVKGSPDRGFQPLPLPMKAGVPAAPFRRTVCSTNFVASLSPSPAASLKANVELIERLGSVFDCVDEKALFSSLNRNFGAEHFFKVATSISAVPSWLSKSELAAAVALYVHDRPLMFRVPDRHDTYTKRPRQIVERLQAAATMLGDETRLEAVLRAFAERRALLAYDFQCDPDAPPPALTLPSEEFPLTSEKLAAPSRLPFAGADIDLAVRMLVHTATLRERDAEPSGVVADALARLVRSPATPAAAENELRRLRVCTDFNSVHRFHAFTNGDVIEPPPLSTVMPLETALVDVDAQLRVDFGDEVALAIDDSSTTEVEHAVSVERLSNGDVWVHVHVADVTSLKVMQAKRPEWIRSTSVRLPEQTIPMLPAEIVAHCSLDAGERNGGAPVSALTFSMQLDRTTGKLTKWRVQPTRVRVRRILSDAVDAILSGQTSSLTDGLSARVVDDVKLLHEIAQRRLNLRATTMNAVPLHMPRPLVKVSKNGTITIKVERLPTACTTILDELAVLAGEAAAREAILHGLAAPFCKQRVPSRGIKAAATANDLPALFAFQQQLALETTTTTGTRSNRLGLPFCHATTPLQLCNVVLLHHQLKSVMRGTKPISSSSLSSMLLRIDGEVHEARRLERKMTRHWIGVHLLRTSAHPEVQARTLPAFAVLRGITKPRLLRCQVLSIDDDDDDNGKCTVLHEDTALIDVATYDPRALTVSVGQRVLAVLKYDERERVTVLHIHSHSK